MGFLNSDSQGNKDQILRDVAIVNSALRDIAKIIDLNGINRGTINSINSGFSSIESNVVRISSTVQSMSDSQLSGFNVPWTDGRYLGIMTWLLSMSTMAEKISNEIEQNIR